MPQPTGYTPTTDFSQDESSNVGGRSTVRTANLDAEFANIETTLDATLVNLALIQRDDGELVDGLVELSTLSAAARSALQLNLNPRGLWLTATAYAVNDAVDSGGVTYVCVTAHTSAAAFSTDYAASKWMALAGLKDQWVLHSGAPAFVSAISFTVPGDQTGTLTVNRRVKTTNTGGTVYSTITGSSYSGGTGLTTIQVDSDSGALDSGLSAVSYGLLTPTSASLPANFNPFGLVRTLSANVGTNALSLATTLRQIDFRSATASNGAPSSPASSSIGTLTVPSGATMGQSNGVAARLWVAVLNNAGTLELAVINTQLGNGQIAPISESGFISTTVMNAASDNAGVWYSTTARASVAFRLIGYIESTQAAAGTWATSPSVVQAMGPGVHKPGDVIQTVGNAPAASNTGTTQLPADATIPQIAEGDQYMTQTITPSSAINTLVVNSALHASTNAVAGTAIGMALFQDATANALKAMGQMTAGVSYAVCLNLRHLMQAGTAAATTFRVRAGANAVGTTTFNALYGAAAGAYIDVTEIMA